ncbi:hypothetical protein E2320_002777 [Naja naja]|nr:hypothetical protein E2320_002777 [Naja naja]
MEGHPVNLLFPTVPVPPNEGIAGAISPAVGAASQTRTRGSRRNPSSNGGGYSARARDVYRARRLRAQPVCVETFRPGQRPVHGYREGRSCPRAQKPLQEFPHRCCLTGFFRLRRQTSHHFPLPQRPGIVSGYSRRYGRPKQKQQRTRHGKGTPMGSYNAEKFRGAISPQHVGQWLPQLHCRPIAFLATLLRQSREPLLGGKIPASFDSRALYTVSSG